MNPDHYIYSIVPAAFVPLAGGIVAGLSGNQYDVDIYSTPLSATGEEPATHYLAGAPCSDEFLTKVQYFMETPIALAATAKIPLTVAQSYCATAKLFVNTTLEAALAECNLKEIQHNHWG